MAGPLDRWLLARWSLDRWLLARWLAGPLDVDVDGKVAESRVRACAHHAARADVASQSSPSCYQPRSQASQKRQSKSCSRTGTSQKSPKAARPGSRDSRLRLTPQATRHGTFRRWSRAAIAAILKLGGSACAACARVREAARTIGIENTRVVRVRVHERGKSCAGPSPQMATAAVRALLARRTLAVAAPVLAARRSLSSRPEIALDRRTPSCCRHAWDASAWTHGHASLRTPRTWYGLAAQPREIRRFWKEVSVAPNPKGAEGVGAVP